MVRSLVVGSGHRGWPESSLPRMSDDPGIFEVGSFFLSAIQSRWFRWGTVGGNEPPNTAISSAISAV